MNGGVLLEFYLPSTRDVKQHITCPLVGLNLSSLVFIKFVSMHW